MYKDRYKQLVRLSVTQPPTPILNMLLGGGRGGGSGTGSGTGVNSNISGSGSGSGSGTQNESYEPGMEWTKNLPESTKKISVNERKEMRRYEQLLPVQALIAYRQQAVTERLISAYESVSVRSSGIELSGARTKVDPYSTSHSTSPPSTSSHPTSSHSISSYSTLSHPTPAD